MGGFARGQFFLTSSASSEFQTSPGPPERKPPSAPVSGRRSKLFYAFLSTGDLLLQYHSIHEPLPRVKESSIKYPNETQEIQGIRQWTGQTP